MLGLANLTGLWRRSLLAYPDGRRDTTSKVQWLQGVGAFGDLRQAVHSVDFSHASSLADLSRLDCERLAEQQAFAGYLTFDGNYFEWNRLIDFQPASSHPDVGSLRWERDILIEQGRDIPYLEHWHRDADIQSKEPMSGAILRHANLGTAAVVVRVGELMMFARDRAITLPRCSSLSECIAAADNVEHARAMLDCEISIAAATANGFCIYASTLPFRVGQLLQAHVNTREWRVKKSEGDPVALGL
jgi:hypothetical protein